MTFDVFERSAFIVVQLSEFQTYPKNRFLSRGKSAKKLGSYEVWESGSYGVRELGS